MDLLDQKVNGNGGESEELVLLKVEVDLSLALSICPDLVASSPFPLPSSLELLKDHLNEKGPLGISDVPVCSLSQSPSKVLPVVGEAVLAAVAEGEPLLTVGTAAAAEPDAVFAWDTYDCSKP